MINHQRKTAVCSEVLHPFFVFSLKHNRYLYNAVLVLLSLIFFPLFPYGMNPISNDGGVIDGAVCAGCLVEDPNFGMDNDMNTYQNYELTAGALTYGTTTYTFGADIPLFSIIQIRAAFPDLVSNTFDGILGENIFNNVEIILLDNLDNPIFQYDLSNKPAVEVLSGASNLIEIKLFNSFSNVRKVAFKAGGLTSIVGDVHLYELYYTTESILPVDRKVETGHFNGLINLPLGLNHQIEDSDHALYNPVTESFDLNSEYSSFKFLLNVNLGTEYIYAKYDWSGSTASGLTNDVFIILEDANLISVSDISLLFNSNLLDVIVEYDDGSSDLFNNGNPFVNVDALFFGSGRFYLQIDADDSKNIEAVEVRLKPFLNLFSELKLFTIFVAPPSTNNPLPIETVQIDVIEKTDYNLVNWIVNSEVNVTNYIVEHSFVKGGDQTLLAEYIVPVNTDANQNMEYSQKIDTYFETTYVQIYAVNTDGEQGLIGIESINGKDKSLVFYPNPCVENVTLLINEGEMCILFDMHGGMVRTLYPGENNLVGIPSGSYIIHDPAGVIESKVLIIR